MQYLDETSEVESNESDTSDYRGSTPPRTTSPPVVVALVDGNVNVDTVDTGNTVITFDDLERLRVAGRVREFMEASLNYFNQIQTIQYSPSEILLPEIPNRRTRRRLN